jgi:carboxymethylenebutenolidase
LPGFGSQDRPTASKGVAAALDLLDAYGVAHGMIEFDNGVDHRRAFFAHPPEPGSMPGIVMVHERWGLDAPLRDVACRLAREGYAVLAPDLFETLGGPSRVEAQIRAVSSALTDHDALRDLRGAVRFLRQRPVPRIGVIGTWGFCMGGRLALLLAGADPDVGPCLDFYGNPVNSGRNAAKPLDPLEAVRRLRGPVFGAFGAEDRSIPAENAHRLDAALEAAGVPHEVHMLPGAGHAFFNDARFSYHEESARAIWPKALAFLRHATER